jgi:hypothetical protein
MIGFNTNKSNREFLYDVVINDAANATGHLVRDKTLSSELKGLVLKKGRVDHQDGGHDDSVIAWLLTHWFVKHTKNLAHYGINPRVCLSLVTNGGALLSPEELEQKRQVTAVLAEIDILKNTLIAGPSLIEKMKAQKLLEHYVQFARQHGELTISLDSIMNDVKDKQYSRHDTREEIAKRNLQRLGFKRAA